MNSIRLSTEKYGSIDIETDYAPHLLRSRSSPISRADGLLLTDRHAIAIELDHGNTISDWCAKLLKASRSNLSTRINAVAYIYGTPRDQRLWFKENDLTDDFATAVAWASRKPIGLLTIGEEEINGAGQYPEEWQRELLAYWPTWS